jgi:hypothetical protein
MPGLRARIASALSGHESLSWAFWTMTVAGSALLAAILAYAAGFLIAFSLASTQNGASDLSVYRAFSLVHQGAWLAFASLCAFAVWRCSTNVTQPRWTYVARAGALAWLAWNAYRVVAPFASSVVAFDVPGAAYLTWPVIAVIASVTVTRVRGGASVGSVVALVLLFIGAALAPFVASAVYGAGIFTTGETLVGDGSWEILSGRSYLSPALAVATLTCFAYALSDNESQRLGYASLAFVLLSAGILAGLERSFT